MTDDERNKKADEIIAAGNAAVIDLKISLSGTDCAGSPRGDDWLAFTDGEYYHQIRKIMLDYGMGEGDVEMIIANAWEDGWIRARKENQI
jgi:hypothetical protein